MSEHETSKASTATDLPTHEEWRAALEEETLLGVECQECGWTSATPKRGCHECHSRDLHGVELPTTGELYTETTITVSPEGFESGYQVGVVDIGPSRVMARIANDVEIGDEVTFTGISRQGDAPVPLFE